MKQLLVFLIFPSILFGQITYSGKIVSKKSKEKIPYASVGLIKENIGTNADENGFFTLTGSISKEHDSLIVSCVGYETAIVEAKGQSNCLIELEERPMILKEVIVNSKQNWNYKILNKLNGLGDACQTTSGQQVQIARHFATDIDNTILSKVNICKSNNLFIPEKATFRLRIYGMDAISKSPSTELCNEVIEVRTKSRVVNIDLEKYQIHIPKRDFFIAIEWLKIKENESGTKDHQTYNPCVGITFNKDKSYNTEVWSLMNYKKNFWMKMMNLKDVAISATVKY